MGDKGKGEEGRTVSNLIQLTILHDFVVNCNTPNKRNF